LGLPVFEPTADGSGPLDLRIPYAGYLDELTEQYSLDRPAWEVARTASYRRRDQLPVAADQEATRRSLYRDVIVMGLDRFRPDGNLAPLFTQALRRAVMSATPDPLPAALHGHNAEGRPHVAFLALPDVGHAHAGGRLMGMAIAIPDLPEEERKAIVGGVLGAAAHDDGGRSFLLEVPRVGQVSLSYRPGLVGPWTLDPRRWRRGSRCWASVTPVVLDRYPDRAGIEDEIARSCLVAGLPEPNEVIASTGALLEGAVRLRPKELPEHLRGRVFRHVRLSFRTAVEGPVLIGSGRYLGIGLFAPVIDPAEGGQR
jgi:CRISPR-associated protein Csb2